MSPTTPSSPRQEEQTRRIPFQFALLILTIAIGVIAILLKGMGVF